MERNGAYELVHRLELTCSSIIMILRPFVLFVESLHSLPFILSFHCHPVGMR